jgi:hypothetical protein
MPRRKRGPQIIVLVLCALSALTKVVALSSMSVQAHSGIPETGSRISDRELGLNRADRSGTALAKEAYSKLPIGFEKNEGQAPRDVRFTSHIGGAALYLTPGQAVLTLPQKGRGPLDASARAPEERVRPRAATLRMRLKGGNPKADIVGQVKLTGTCNYIIGNNPGRWHVNVPVYDRVAYNNVYPGIDLTFHGNNQQLEYSFSLSPGADAHKIRISFKGVRSLRVDGNGNLSLQTEVAEVSQLKPLIYQLEGDSKRPVEGRFAVKGRYDVGFEIGDYDHTKTLVIDPIFQYSTFLGGTSGDSGRAIAIDSAGNAYVTGSTTSFDFPTTSGAYSTTYRNGDDVFVTKLNPAGSALVYSTFIGGNNNDDVGAIAVDSLGNAYVAGGTSSTDYPTTAGAFQGSKHGGVNGFVTKLNPAGNALLYSSYLGGSSGDSISAMVIDASGNAYTAGSTTSFDFPITPGAFQTTLAGNSFPATDAFVCKVDPTGSTLVYSTYLGGSSTDQASGIRIDSAGEAYVTGTTASGDFPTTAGTFQPHSAGTPLPGGFPPGSLTNNCFVTQLNASGTALIYSTYVGGSGGDTSAGIALDSSGNAFITGTTDSTDFPTTPGVFRASNGGAFKTTNSGGNWGPINSGLASPNIISLSVDPTVSSTIYAGTPGVGIFKSTDQGGHWLAIDAGLTDMGITSIAVDPTSSVVIWLGTSTRGVFKSTDGGGTWNAMDTGEHGAFVAQLVVDPVSPTTVYAATNLGVFKTVNGGAGWSQVGGSLLGNTSTIAMDPGNRLTLYAAGSSSGNFPVFKTTDGGASWNGTNISSNSPIRAVVVGSTAAVYATTSLGVQRSTDGGANWNATNSGLTDLNVRAIALASSAVYAGTNSGVFKSTNGGTSWSLANAGMGGVSVSALAIDPQIAANVYAGTSASQDCFVTRVNSAGTALVYSTYLGGSDFDTAQGIAVDGGGSAYVGGMTRSSNFPVTAGGIPPAFQFFQAGFLCKLNTDATGLTYSTMLDPPGSGCCGSTSPNGIAVDPSGIAYVTGSTSNHNFPTTPGAYQTQFTSSFQTNVFISKIAASPGLSTDLQVSLSASPNGMISSGANYTITVMNNGPDQAFDLTVNGNLTPGLLIQGCGSSTFSCQQSGNSILATAPSLAAGASAMIFVSASINCITATDGSSITNTVTVTSLTPDPVPGNNTASVNNAIQSPALSPQSATFAASGGSGSVNVTDRQCGWQAVSKALWIVITSGANSFGNEQVNYAVGANNGPARMGTITIAGQTFTINQGANLSQVSRTFVSGNGNDGNPCSLGSPCRTLTAAVGAVSTGGEVVVLDSAGYSPAFINKSVSIIAAEGVYAGVSVSSGDGITVGAGPVDTVILRGITLNGVGGSNGITFNSGLSLLVEKCAINGFASNGISFNGGGQLSVKDSAIRNSGGAGVSLSGSPSASATATLERVRLEANGTGLAAFDRAKASIRDSVSSGNSVGFSVAPSGSLAEISIEKCLIANNGTGAMAGPGTGFGILRIAKCVLTENGVALSQQSGNVILSGGRNRLGGNTTNTNGTIGDYTLR